MQNTGNIVIEEIEKWADALRAGDVERAMTIAASLPSIGSPLCEHPDFERVANAMNQRMDSGIALDGASWLLMCLAELKARDAHAAPTPNAHKTPRKNS